MRTPPRDGKRRVRVLYVLCSLFLTYGCDNGGVIRSDTTPTTPNPSGAPEVAVTAVIPQAGAALNYTVRFSIAAGSACGQGLLGGAALVLDDGTVQDTIDVNGRSGFALFSVDPNCSVSGTAGAAVPQRLPSLSNIMHIVAVVLYLSPASADTLGTPPIHYPTLSSAVASSRYATNLYLIAEPSVPWEGPLQNVSGQWNGAIQDSTLGNGSLVLSLNQITFNIGGSWSFTWSGSGSHMSGSVVGTIVDSVATLLLTPIGGVCPLVLSLNVNSGSTSASGAYAPAPGCSSSSGTASASKA